MRGSLLVLLTGMGDSRDHSPNSSSCHDRLGSARISDTDTRTFGIELGSSRFDPGMPLLAGEPTESLFGPARATGNQHGFALYETDGWLLGHTSTPVQGDLTKLAQEIYQNLFLASRGMHLARIWNYVPFINATGPTGLENYRAFCGGRSIAFERQFGTNFAAMLPAASAVGTERNLFTVVFAATHAPARHVENPLQVPAYGYPADYGPRAPSFARASVLPSGYRPSLFVSGTASVRGHSTVAPGSTRDQLVCTLENLREIRRACEAGPDRPVQDGTAAYIKVYLRHRDDLGMVSAMLDRDLLRPGDRVTYLQADICRSQLNVEIELSHGMPTR